MKLSLDRLGKLKIATTTILMLLLMIIVMTGSASAGTPTVQLIYPTGGENVSGVITIQWSVTNATHDHRINIEYYIPDKKVWKVIDAGLSHTTTQYTWDTSGIKDGYGYKIKVIVYNNTIEVNATSGNFTIDNTPPSIEIVNPAEGDLVGKSLRVVVNVSDNLFLKNVTVKLINGSGAKVFNTTNESINGILSNGNIINVEESVSLTGISEGNYTLVVEVYDMAGNNASKCINISVDPVDPIAEILYPSEGGYVRGTVEIRGNASDPNFEKYIVMVMNETGQVVFKKENYQQKQNESLAKWITTNYDDGNYKIILEVHDKAENINRSMVNVTVDNTPPTIKLVQAPKDGYIIMNVSESTVKVNFTASDNLASTLTYIVYINGSVGTKSTISNGTYKEISITLLEDGTYRWNITVLDGANNSNASETRILIRDTKPPRAEILNITPSDRVGGKYIISGVVEIRGNATDENILNYTVIVKNGTWNMTINESNQNVINGVLARWDTRKVTDGNYTIILRVYDKAGRHNESVVNVIVDNTPKTILLEVPSTVTVGNDVEVRVTVKSTFGRELEGIQVLFGTTAGIITPAINVTNDNGIATATFKAPTKVGKATITVCVANNPFVMNSTTIELVPGEYKDAKVYAVPEEIPADGNSTTTITVKLVDIYGNLNKTSGVYVYLKTTAGWFITENGLKNETYGYTKDGIFNATLVSTTEPTTATIIANIAGVGERSTKVVFYAPAEIIETLELDLSKGWQMISVPLKSPIKCDEKLITYTWDAVNRTYVEAKEFEPGKGYWVLSTKDMTVTFTGSGSLDTCVVNLTKGWNMIGTIAYEVYLPTLVKDHPIAIYAYTWDPTMKKYVLTYTLEPGKAYWIFALNNTTLQLTATPPPPPS